MTDPNMPAGSSSSSSSSKCKPYHKPHFTLLFIAAAVVGFLAVLFVLFTVFSPNKSSGLPVSIQTFDSSYMSNEHRMGEVAEWAKDVADNMKNTDKRTTFADAVDNYVKDGIIEAGEYDAIGGLYAELKANSYLDIINNSVTDIRTGTHSTPAESCAIPTY